MNYKMVPRLKVILFMCYFISNVFGDDSIIITHPDTSSLERMCASNDLYCVRNEFLKYGWCVGIPVKKQNPLEPYRIKEMCMELPSINCTVVDKNINVTGLENGKIIEYYFNKKTNSVLLSIKFKDVTINKTASLYYHRPAQEDLLVIAKATEFYPSITTTTITSGYKKFQSYNTKTFGRVNELPTYNFPGLEDVTDPEVVNIFAGIKNQLYGCVQELVFHRARYFAEYFAQNVICNRKFNPSENNTNND